ncbi:hypothetical protein JCM10908_003190 [Rhodotorula pacifica]|uniref:uncharacterized protein n=1 Tax=Rhodotorula pacifica TaxID=1495444 RepID=UPI00316F5460
MPGHSSESGLDGWFVCGAAHDDLLFYSKHATIRLADGKEVNIERASRAHWTPVMHNAHREVRAKQTLAYPIALTPLLDGIRWDFTGHIPPEHVEWACQMTPLDDDGKTQEQPEDRLTGFSATVLRYTLAWPPLDLERAVSPTLQALVPATRLRDEQARVFLPPAGESTADTIRGSHRPLTYLPPPDSSTSRGQPGWRPFPSGFHAHPDPHLSH